MTHIFPPKAETPADRRAFLLHYAGVLDREADARAGSDFATTLRLSADRARRDAAALSPQPIQMDLFSQVAA